MPTVTGIEKVSIAKLLADTINSINFATPAYYEGIQELDIKPKQNSGTQYAENRLKRQSNVFESYGIDMSLSDLANAQRAEILGQTVAAEGGVYASQEDDAPFVALLYKATMSEGGYRYGVFYKGMFGLPEDAYKGQEGKIDYQSAKASATFQPLDYVITGADGKKKHLTEWHVDTTDPNCPADIDDTWFTSVKFPTVDSAAPTVTVVPADEATGVLGSANIVWTFSKALDASTVNDKNFMLLSGGTSVAGALGIDVTGKIVTFDPTAALASGTYVAVCTANVKSAVGTPLAANSITNFTV